MPPKRNQNRPRTKNQNKTVDAMSDCVLPQEEIAAIFARLPVKSLMRFKCVCKPLCRLVTNPNFIKLHSRLFPKTPKTFSFHSHLLKCPILGVQPDTKLLDVYLDSCNGLVCMGRPLVTRDIVLWNPATNLQKTLPPSTVEVGAAAMVSLGFGCSADGDDFKVVRISILKGKKMTVVVEVYSSKSDSWRKIDLNVGHKFTLLAPKNHVIVNGNPHWIVRLYEKEVIEEGGECQVLMGFDSTRAKFMFLPLPDVEKLGQKLPFANWKGRVGVIACGMKDDDRLEWIEMWIFDYGEMQWRRDARFGPMDVLADMCLDVSKAGKIVGGCPNGRLFIYDPETNRVGLSKLKRRVGCSFQLFAYDESLVHLKGMVPVVVKKEDHGDKYNDMDGFFVANLHHGSGELSCYYALAF